MLTGFGEPLIDKTLEQKIAYAKQYGLNTYIISNASLLTRKRAASLIEARLDEMRVSFYGTRPETYNVVMQNLDFNVSMSTLRAFLELRAAPGKRTPRPEVNYLILSENEPDREAFREFCELRADAIEIWKPHNFGDGRDYRIRLDDLQLKNTYGRPENSRPGTLGTPRRLRSEPGIPPGSSESRGGARPHPTPGVIRSQPDKQ